MENIISILINFVKKSFWVIAVFIGYLAQLLGAIFEGGSSDLIISIEMLVTVGVLLIAILGLQVFGMIRPESRLNIKFLGIIALGYMLGSLIMAIEYGGEESIIATSIVLIVIIFIVGVPNPFINFNAGVFRIIRYVLAIFLAFGMMMMNAVEIFRPSLDEFSIVYGAILGGAFLVALVLIAKDLIQIIRHKE